MEGGLGFAEAVSEAQELGYAEADPTADVEGHDVRLKVVILANELLDAKLKVSDVTCSGISSLDLGDIEKARQDGARWKLIGAAMRHADGSISASVEPRLLKHDHPLSGISGATNAVSFTTDLLGAVTVSGPGAGRTETAFALLSDIISIHQSVAHN
jgi:homoserine dehydrogenase